jgi:hypothetical protein
MMMMLVMMVGRVLLLERHELNAVVQRGWWPAAGD